MPSLNSNYDSHWEKCVSGYSRKETDAAQCSVNFILDFLAELFDLGHKYRSINLYRFAISAYHCYLERKLVGQQKQVCALLKGVFTKKPLQLGYVFTWDVQVMLDFIKNRWESFHSLSDRDLTFKLLVLLALTSTSRACTIHCLDIRFMARHGLEKWKKFPCC